MMKNSLLWVGLALIASSLYFSGYLSFLQPTKPVASLDIRPPANAELKELTVPVIEAFENGSSDRSFDAYRLAEVYKDIAVLVEVDENIIKTTEALRQANILTAKILRIDLTGKYPGLADAANDLFTSYVTSDAVSLDEDLRAKSVDAFNALAWACLEGSKK